MNQSELAQVLQALSQQQAALLQAHADGMRLQRVLVEQMLDARQGIRTAFSLVPELTPTSPVPDAVNSMTSLPATVDPVPTPVVTAPLLLPSAVIEQHPVEAIVSAPLPGPEEPTTVDGERHQHPCRKAQRWPALSRPSWMPLAPTPWPRRAPPARVAAVRRGISRLIQLALPGW